MQSFVAHEDCLPRIQHCGGEDGIAMLDQLADPGFVTPAGDGANQQSIGPQHTANMVFDVNQLALEEFPVGQQSAHPLHFDVLNMGRAVPAQSHYLCDAACIIPISFVAHRRKRNTHMAGFSNNDRGPQPAAVRGTTRCPATTPRHPRDRGDPRSLQERSGSPLAPCLP